MSNAQTVVPVASDSGGAVRVALPFPAPVAAAIFARAERLWLVFDTDADIDFAALRAGFGDRVTDIATSVDGGATTIRLTLAAPALVSAAAEGNSWVVALGDASLPPPARIALERAVRADGRGLLQVAYPGAGRIHLVSDPVLGDRLIVATATGPAQALVAPQRYAELVALPTAQGLALAPIADDVAVTRDGDALAISRPGGLALSTPGRAASAERMSERKGFVDLAAWRDVAPEEFTGTVQRLRILSDNASAYERPAKRVELATFLLSRQCGLESLGLLKLSAEEDGALLSRPSFSILVAAANVVSGRFDDASRVLSSAAFAGDPDAAVWRMLAADGLRDAATVAGLVPLAEPVLPDYPAFVQQQFQLAAGRAAMALGDAAAAQRHLAELGKMTLPAELLPWRDVLTGQLAALAGRSMEAETALTRASESPVGPAASEARLNLIRIAYDSGHITAEQAVADFDGLAAGWRGDQTELVALSLLADLAAGHGDYRAAFSAMRSSISADSTSDITAATQRRMEAVFAGLFLEDAHALPPIEGLALYYDYREMTPIGRRGDAMVRKLADRLLAVDLVEQAAELLRYQVDERLSGAARSQVAADLAVIRLMEGDPRGALQVLRRTDQAQLPGVIERQRRLVEARAMAAAGEAKAAMELLGAMTGADVDRLKVDILWGAGDWRGVGNAVERMQAGRWSDAFPLSDAERRDLMMAAMAYARAEDEFGLERIRSRFSAKMADSPDAQAFATVTRPIGAAGGDFRTMVREAAAMGSIDAFVADYRKRYLERPETEAEPAAPA